VTGVSPPIQWLEFHMTSALATLPPDRGLALAAAYGATVRAKRLRMLLSALALIVCSVLAAIAAEIDTAKFLANISRFPNYLRQLVPPLSWPNLGADLAEWFWGWKLWGRLLVETLLIAYLGTVLGAVGAVLLAFHAGANVTPSRLGRATARRFLEFCRTVPEIVFALIFVIAFGLGPVPGVMAIAIHTLGALGKQFAEAIENIDMKPVEGLVATGASWSESMRFGALPQVASNLMSYALMRFEINVRGAAIMGFVGAGGIGQELLTAVRKFYYSDISAMLVMIIATVMVIDMCTERLRHGLLGRDGRT
jgi:phosphonate transport system permease protein